MCVCVENCEVSQGRKKKPQKGPDVLFQGRRRKWKNGPHSYVTHLRQSPAPVQPAARLIMSYCVSARRERATPAQLPAGPLASPPLRRRVENTLTWRPPYFPSVWEERGKKNPSGAAFPRPVEQTVNSGAEALGYCGSGKADGVSVATRRGQPEDGGGEEDLIFARRRLRCSVATGPLNI